MERKKDEETGTDRNAEANSLIASGAGIAAIGIAGAMVSGAVCPVCVVAAPALLGLGAVRKLRAAKRRAEAKGSS